MSRDGQLLVLIALGQVASFVWIVNVVHALGLGQRVMDRFKIVMLSLLVAGSAGLAWEAAHGPWAAWSFPLRVHATLCLAVAVVGVPVATLVRLCRRNPTGIAVRDAEIDLAATFGADALVGPGRHSWMFRLPGNESLRLRRREWEVVLPGLPAAWDGLSLIQWSDLHFAPPFRREFFERVADEAASWEADLVLFTGDLVDHDDAIDWIVPVMSRVRGRLGTYSILGNHDVEHHPGRLCRLLGAAGYTDLEGRWTTLDIKGRTLALGGTSAPWGPKLDPSALPEADFRLLLSHSPDLLTHASRWGIDLMLSGHNHGGQIRLPVVGPVFMPSLYSRRFDRDFFRAERTLLHVSQGVAGQHPIRYGCVPEISRLVLRVPKPRLRGLHKSESLDKADLSAME